MPRVIPVPQNAEELRDQLTDRRVMAELLKEPDKFAEHIEASIRIRGADRDINGQAGEQAQAFMTEWLKNNSRSEVDAIAKRLNLDTPAARGAVHRNSLYNKNAIGAKHDQMFNSLGGFFHGISEHSAKDSALSEKLVTLKNDLSSVKPSDGGFLIPEVLRSEMLRIAYEKAIVRSRARIIPMDSLTVPFPTVEQTSNTSSVYGGIVGYWTEEGATLTESQPKFARVELRANKLALYTEVPNELLQDARPALEMFLSEIFPEAIAWFEDIGFTVGGGVGEPLGYLNAPAAITITRTASGQNVDWADIANMYSRMLPASLDRAVWTVTPDLVPNLLTMPFVVGGTTTPMLLGGASGFPEGNSGMPMTILGRPVVVTEKVRTAGVSGDINFVDFGYYLIGDRQALSARQSEEYRFQNDITAFRVTERLDGRPWIQGPITPQNGGATLSPFVKLA